MEVTWQMILTVCPLIFMASAIDAIAGGGGLISLPAYYLAGLPPVLAAGSNKFSASFGTLIASVKYARSGKVHWAAAIFAVLGALPGSWLGAELLKIAPETLVRMILLIGVPAMAVVMLIKKPEETGENVSQAKSARERLLCFAIGLAIGFYDGFFGPGTGTMLIILFTLLIKMNAVTASGTAKIVNLASNVGSLISFVTGGCVLYALAIPAMFCAAAGGYVGSSLAIKGGAKVIRVVMLVVMAMLLVKIAWDTFAG